MIFRNAVTAFKENCPNPIPKANCFIMSGEVGAFLFFKKSYEDTKFTVWEKRWDFSVKTCIV
jgi:hypothetical protein